MRKQKQTKILQSLWVGFLLFLPTIASAQTINRVDQNEVTSETTGQIATFVNFIIVKIPSFIAAFILAILFYVLAKALKRIVEDRVAAQAEDNAEIQILAGRTTYATTLIVGITVALKVAGIDLTTIIAAVGLGVGFALKDIITNFLAGVMLLAQRQFTIGDYINVNNTIGKILEIQTRATVLQALDGTKVVVPNADLFNKQVTSYTSNPFRRIEITVGVEYSTDLKLAVETCFKATQDTEGILLEPKAVVLVDKFADSSINLLVRIWVESNGPWLQIKSNLAINIKKALDNADINIPFPIRTVEFAKGDDITEGPKWLQEEAKKIKDSKPVESKQVPHEMPKVEIPAVQKPIEEPKPQVQPVQAEQPKVAEAVKTVSQPAVPQTTAKAEQKPQTQVNPQAEQKPAADTPKDDKHVFELPGMNQ